MSDLLIQAALERRLAAMSPAMATANENTNYAPALGTPYQEISFLPAEPDDETMGRSLTKYQGIFQVLLRYPQGAGRGAAQARAESIREQFRPTMTLTEGAVNVHIHKTPKISGGYRDGDRWVVPISIPWHAYIAS